MRYAALIYGSEATNATMSEAEQQAEFIAYNSFGDVMGARGVLGGGEALLPTNTATTVRVRDGKVLATDGPFAETKEQLGGFYLLQCKDLDEAIEVASQIPGAKNGAIEIRPIMEFES
jgi:hypothetical protein